MGQRLWYDAEIMYIDPKTSELEMLYLREELQYLVIQVEKRTFFVIPFFFLYRETSFNYSETTLVQSDIWLQ
jgi:hypothetical protein